MGSLTSKLVPTSFINVCDCNEYKFDSGSISWPLYFFVYSLFSVCLLFCLPAFLPLAYFVVIAVPMFMFVHEIHIFCSHTEWNLRSLLSYDHLFCSYGVLLN